MKRKKNDIFNVNLDPEEQEISDAVDQAIAKGKLKSIDDLDEELAFAQEARVGGCRQSAAE
jgi:hypothetical protein